MTVNGRYDPNHPDADWSGYVATVPSKKHIEAPPSQLTSHDMGIAPNEGKISLQHEKFSLIIQTNPKFLLDLCVFT